MFAGSIPALVTPFSEGTVDQSAMSNLIERQIVAGSKALVPVGTTGETSTLTPQEHMDVVELCVKRAAGRVPVIAGAGANATSEAIELVSHAKKIGADAALVVCPYYNRPNQDGLYAHFEAINKAVELPVFLYNVPSRTSCDLLPETVGRLAHLPNIIGIKDASADVARVVIHSNLAGNAQFIQLSGEDATALAHRASGGAGCISVTANVAPELCAQMHTACDENDWETARAIDAKLAQLHEMMFCSPSPGPAKYALSLLGLCENNVRLPILSPDEKAREKIRDAMIAAGIEIIEDET